MENYGNATRTWAVALLLPSLNSATAIIGEDVPCYHDTSDTLAFPVRFLAVLPIPFGIGTISLESIGSLAAIYWFTVSSKGGPCAYM